MCASCGEQLESFTHKTAVSTRWPVWEFNRDLLRILADTHTHKHTKQHVCLLKNMFPCSCMILLMLPVSSLTAPPLLPVCIPPLVWRSAPTPQTRSGAPNEQHSSKSRPFDRCKSAVPLPRSPCATMWPQRFPQRAVELHVPTEPGRLACEKNGLSS